METLDLKIFTIQNEVGKMSKDKENPFFHSKYADLNQILDNLNPLFETSRIRVSQPLTNVDGRPALALCIRDLDSQEVIREVVTLPDLQDPQKMGSAITYYRRYSLVSFFRLQTEEDDDGNKASSKSDTREKAPYTKVADVKAYQEKNKKDMDNGVPAF
jgi:hypothetical protein